MSDKDEDEQKQKEKLFMTETSGLEREESLLRPKSSKINSATTNDLATADDADEDEEDVDDEEAADEDQEQEEELEGEEEGDEYDGDEDDDEDDEDEDEDEEEMDDYGDNPFFEYQLPREVEVAGGEAGENTGGERVEERVESVDGIEQVEEEIRPLSAVAPKIFQQPDDGNVQIEISSTPAFQCLEEVFPILIMYIFLSCLFKFKII